MICGTCKTEIAECECGMPEAYHTEMGVSAQCIPCALVGAHLDLERAQARVADLEERAGV